VSPGSGVLGSVRVAASIAILIAATGAGCASQEYLIRSDHFSVTVPRTWEVVRLAGPADGPAVVHVPGPRVSGGDGVPLALYFFPWLERSPIAQPTQEAFARLVSSDELDLKAAGPPDRNHCNMLIDHLWLFGALQPARHVETPGGDHIIVAAGQARGSLVAVVGVVPASASTCAGVEAMQEAMRSLSQKLVGADPSDRVFVAGARFAPYPPNRPALELPAP
jgi:hypothetical protein